MTLGLLSLIKARFRSPDCALGRPILANGLHLPALDAIRGLAILMVTAYRFNGGHSSRETGGSLLSLFESGFRGVDLFFVLSGFLITGILYDAKGKSHYFRNFYMRRTLRIFPLYYGALVVVFVVLPMASPWAHSLFRDAADHQGWLWAYGTNVYQAWTGQWAFGRFNHFWSLAVEEHFYLIWPFVIHFLARRTALRACAIIFCLSWGARVSWLAFGGNDAAAEVFTLFRVDSLVAGAWLALVARGPLGIKGLVPVAWIGLLASGAALAVLAFLNRRFLTATDPLFASFFGSLIVLASSLRRDTWLGQTLGGRFLCFLGKYSYGMYVFQNLLIPVAAPFLSAERIEDVLHSAIGGRIAYIAIMSLITVGLAFLSYHAYEKHFLRLKAFFADSKSLMETERSLSPKT